MFHDGYLLEGANRILDGLKIDPEDPNAKDTPKRMVRMFNEVFMPEEVRVQKVKAVLTKTFPSKYQGMVISEGIRVYSMCIHHFLPITMDVVIGYVPKNVVLGLSKLARVADLFARQPLIQEDYTIQLATAIWDTLHPDGVGVYVKGRHFCQEMRGAKQRDALMVTTQLVGCFKDDAKTRSEFLSEVRSTVR